MIMIKVSLSVGYDIHIGLCLVTVVLRPLNFPTHILSKVAPSPNMFIMAAVRILIGTNYLIAKRRNVSIKSVNVLE